MQTEYVTLVALAYLLRLFYSDDQLDSSVGKPSSTTNNNHSTLYVAKIVNFWRLNTHKMCGFLAVSDLLYFMQEHSRREQNIMAVYTETACDVISSKYQEVATVSEYPPPFGCL